MPADNDHSSYLDIDELTEMAHETMMVRWRQGLVTPMSLTISTFVKTDGTWWTAGQTTWQRILAAEHNERLDLHHDRFKRTEQSKFPATTAEQSPWDKRPSQSLFRARAAGSVPSQRSAWT